MKNNNNLNNKINMAFYLGVKNTFHKKVMLFLISCIIGLGFLSSIFSSSIIYGLQDSIENKAIEIISGDILIEVKDGESSIYGVSEIEKKILSLKNVVAVSPHINSAITLIDDNGNKISVQLRIVDPRKEAETTILDEIILRGNYFSKYSEGILIGGELTKRFRTMDALPYIDTDSGKLLTAVFPNGKMEKIKVQGIYSQEFAGSDIYVYMTEEKAKKVFNISDNVDEASEILIKTTQKYFDEKKIKSDLNYLGINAKITSWTKKLGAITQVTDSLLIISKMSAIIGIIVAFATIYIMIFISVLQKQTQIGVLKAIGIPKKVILGSYLVQSLFYGIFGSIIGILITSVVMYYMTLNPLMMPMGEIIPIIKLSDYVTSTIVLLGSSLIAGYFASNGVIKKNILDAIYNG